MGQSSQRLAGEAPDPMPTTREKILSTSYTLFAEQGFDGTSLNDIATRIGIRRPSLLHHFPSKEAIYREVMRNALQEWGELVEKAVAEDQNEGWSKVDSVLSAAATFFYDNPEFLRIVRREAIQGGDHLGFEIGAALRPFYEQAVDHFRRGIAEGRYVDHDPEHLLLVGYGALLTYFSDAHMIAGLLGRDPLDPDVVSVHLDTIRAVFRGFLQP